MINIVIMVYKQGRKFHRTPPDSSSPQWEINPSVITVTRWTVRGSNPGGARFSAPFQTDTGAHPASCTMGIGPFSGVEWDRGVTLTPQPLLVPRSKTE
jgi:hypothetical protein